MWRWILFSTDQNNNKLERLQLIPRALCQTKWHSMTFFIQFIESFPLQTPMNVILYNVDILAIIFSQIQSPTGSHAVKCANYGSSQTDSVMILTKYRRTQVLMILQESCFENRSSSNWNASHHSKNFAILRKSVQRRLYFPKCGTDSKEIPSFYSWAPEVHYAERGHFKIATSNRYGSKCTCQNCNTTSWFPKFGILWKIYDPHRICHSSEE